MKILFVDWVDYHSDEIMSGFMEHGYQVERFVERTRNYHYDPVLRKKLTAVLSKDVDFVFSVQYFPVLSNICNRMQLPYIAWCFNDPLNFLLLTEEIYHSCNVIFHTDTAWVEKLQHRGVQKVFYLPPAVSGHFQEKNMEIGRNDTDQRISVFEIGKLDGWQRYFDFLSGVDERTKGFFMAVLHAQKSIYGFDFFENILYDDKIEALKQTINLWMPTNSIASEEEFYSFFVLYPAVTKMEADELLDELQKYDKSLMCTHYTEEKANVTVEKYFNQGIWNVWESSKKKKDADINLLISSREIQNGIPAQAMELLSADGLLITNFKNDYLSYFEPGVDLVFYESAEDAIEKIEYYFLHEKERTEIFRNAHKKLQEMHTVGKRIEEMLECIKRAVV